MFADGFSDGMNVKAASDYAFMSGGYIDDRIKDIKLVGTWRLYLDHISREKGVLYDIDEDKTLEIKNVSEQGSFLTKINIFNFKCK